MERLLSAALALALGSIFSPCSLPGQERLTAERVVAATGVTAGLCVHLGVTDGRLEAELAGSGRMLVHGLALDDRAVVVARKVLIAEGLYGVASVQRRHHHQRLPYAANLVNLLIADKTLLEADAVSDAEVQRVLVPGGVAHIKDGRGWKSLRKPWPAGMDHWTHFDYDCTNNGVSKDRQVGPVTTLKWIEGYRTAEYHKSQTGAFRSSDGVLVHQWRVPDYVDGRVRRLQLLCARDAFNGIRYWHMPVSTRLSSIVVDDGRIFTMANPDDPLGPMRAYDLRTGRERLRFHEGGLMETPEQAGGTGHAYEAGAPRWVRILYHNGRLFQAAGEVLYCLDPQTGRRNWIYSDPDGHRLLFATYAPDLKLVFVANTKKAAPGKMFNDWGEWNSRWPASKLVAVTALDAVSGKPVWRNEKVAGQTASQLIYDRGKLAYFSASGIGAMGNKRDADDDSWAWLGVVDAKTGHSKWSLNYRKHKPPLGGKPVHLAFAFTIVMRDGKLYVGANNYLMEFDAETGEPLARLVPPIPNARCTRPRQTVDYQIMGFGTFVARDFRTMVIQNISRSDCMTGPTPANGMTYHTPNGCTCFAQLRGFAGYASEPLWKPLPIQQRLVRGDERPPAPLLDSVIPTRSVETYRVGSGDQERAFRRPTLQAGPIRSAWIGNDVLPYPETSPVTVGTLKLVGVVNEHRLEARQGNRVAWSYVAGGRISAPPVVHQGKVYFGSHDGYVTCLNAGDGRRLWRFMAAPNDRRIVAYGQLESSWPVYGVVVHQGLIAASAGRHPELDGGIYFYGLDPDTGQAKWDGRLYVPAEVFTAGKGQIEGKPRHWTRPANTIINAPLVVKDGKLLLISPDMTNEGIARPPRHYQLVIDPEHPPLAPAE